MSKLLVIDNYDSFTYNLVQLAERIMGVKPVVLRNNKLEISDVEKFDRILLSPGPGIPLEAGLMPEIVRTYSGKMPILGVCLGHQCIGEIFGARLTNMQSPVHGKASKIKILDKNEILFKGLPDNFDIARYHSWLVDEKDLPDAIVITAVDNDGNIMALRHKSFDVRGVQFHPESVMTEYGHEILKNWIES